MAKWYLYEDDEVVGPYTPQQLRGRLAEEALVCRAGSEDWVKAGDVADLAECFDETEPDKTITPGSSGTGAETGDVDDANSGSTARDANDDVEELETKNLIEPTLEKLRSICERAENNELLVEYEDHWDAYDPEERRVILQEIENRGIMDS